MSNLFQTVLNFFTPKPVPRIIETVNECGEKRYIELETPLERQYELELLLTKCKRLLSFVEKTEDVRVFEKLALFVVKVRQAKYKGDDIRYLFHEFEEIENFTKRSSKSFNNLSEVIPKCW
jgi:hypothetical protein